MKNEIKNEIRNDILRKKERKNGGGLYTYNVFRLTREVCSANRTGNMYIYLASSAAAFIQSTQSRRKKYVIRYDHHMIRYGHHMIGYDIMWYDIANRTLGRASVSKGH